jgi:hypothetical protein
MAPRFDTLMAKTEAMTRRPLLDVNNGGQNTFKIHSLLLPPISAPIQSSWICLAPYCERNTKNPSN